MAETTKIKIFHVSKKVNLYRIFGVEEVKEVYKGVSISSWTIRTLHLLL